MRLLGWISLLIYLACDLGHFQLSEKAYLLSPKSTFILPQQQKESAFLANLKALELIKEKVIHFRGKRPEELKQKITLLLKTPPTNREEYLRGRKMFSWWRFYYDWFGLYNEELSESFLSEKIKQFETNYFSRLPEDLFSYRLKEKPIWGIETPQEAEKTKSLEQIEAISKEKERVKAVVSRDEEIWNNVAASATKINDWLMSEGVLTKSLHLVHGLSIEEIKKAIDSNNIHVKIYPEARGGFKYVLRITVTVNNKPYLFALDGYHSQSKVVNMDREISTLNLSYRPYNVPAVGEINTQDEFWLEEFIEGKHPIDFIMWYEERYANLSEEQKRNSNSVEEMLKEIQLRSATQFLLHYLQDLATTTSIMDPHQGNIKITWVESNQQINLKEVNLFDIGDLDTTTKLKPVIIDVGSLEPVASEVWFYFKYIYGYYYKTLPRQIKGRLPSTSIVKVTKLDFLNSFLSTKGLKEEEQILLISSIMQHIQEKETNDLEAQKFYQDLENDLILKAEAQIKEGGTLEKWTFILSVASKENSFKLYSRVNDLLEKLAQQTVSAKTRQIASKNYLERTGRMPSHLFHFTSSPTELERAL